MAHYFIDALRNDHVDNDWFRSFANVRDGAPARITYDFMRDVPDDVSTYDYGDPALSFTRYTAAERAAVTRALADFEAVANVRFTRSSDAPVISFGQFSIEPGTAGFASYPTYDKTAGALADQQVWLDRAFGVTSNYVIHHEIGHALGLKHPFEGDARLPDWEDNARNTVMSYDRDSEDMGLALYDVIALQSIYGPAAYRRNDNVYVFGEDKLIWDGGGEDRVTARGSDAAVTIDLRSGSWNHAGAKGESLLWSDQVFLGYFSDIEHAVGGAHDDRLRGNGLDNRLLGREGDDDLVGRGGRDRLIGGDDDDLLRGGDGRDRMLGGDGDDRLEGGAHSDILRGGAGADRFIFDRLSDSPAVRGDLVLDFTDGDAIDVQGLAEAIPDLTFIGRDRFSGSAGEARYDHRASEGTRFVIDADGDGTPDFRLAFEGRVTLGQDDLMI